MNTAIKTNLTAYARAYADSCERDYEAAQKRLDNARRIVEHLKAGHAFGACPCPMLNETAGQAERFAARVDALLMAAYDEERS